MTFTVSDLASGDYAAWRPLWDDYCTFYKVEIPEKVTARTWQRLIDPQFPLYGRVVRVQGRIAGFAIHVPHVSTWQEGAACYLEDLFVAPEARGTGAGRALIDDLLSICEQRGWDRLYWVTDNDNQTARRLYDCYNQADGIVRYTLKL